MSNPADTLVLVTGVTGFIGSHIAVELLRQGYQVRGTMRKLSRSESIKEVIGKSVGTELLSFAQAELTQPESWDAAMEGVDYVLHIASPLPRANPKDDQELIVPARDGALNVLKAAERHNVKRMVMTSSAAAVAYGHEEKSRLFTEKDWTNPKDLKDTTAYIRSKMLAEKAAWDALEVSQSKLEFVTILPTLVLGPLLEEDYGTSSLLVKKMFDGDFPAAPKLGFGIVDVRDVADLHIRAMTSPDEPGQRFLADSGFRWAIEVAKYLRGAYPTYKKKFPTFEVPNIFVRLMALFDQETRMVLTELGVKREYDHTKAKEVLGWTPRLPEEAIKATADSILALGISK